MFAQSNKAKETPKVPGAALLLLPPAYLLGVLGGIVLFIILGNKHFGTQVATAVTYTYFAFWYVFFPIRGMLETYSLRNKIVQAQLPRLLAIHCAFLILIVIGQTILFSMKPRLPSYWLREHGKRGDTLFGAVLIVSFVIVFFTQVLISRGILSRCLRDNQNRIGARMGRSSR